MENQLTQFDQLKAEVTLFVEPCFQMTVTSPEESAKALAVGKEVKALLKKVEERRTELVKPHNETVKTINSYAKQISEPLLQAEAHFKKHLVEWEKVLEKKRQEEFKKAEEARKKAEAEAQAKLKAQQEEAEAISMFMEQKDVKRQEIVMQAEAERTVAQAEKDHSAQAKEIASNKVSGARRRLVHRVIDASKVPREFLIVDDSLIRKAIKDGVKEIPGVVIEEEVSIAL